MYIGFIKSNMTEKIDQKYKDKLIEKAFRRLEGDDVANCVAFII